MSTQYEQQDEPVTTDIAIVGMSGRFPGACDTDALWDLVKAGNSALHRLSDEELIAAGVSKSVLADPSYIKVAGTFEGVDQFDAAFFDVAPRDASIMDPQHRHFLECCWSALEHAGHVPESFSGAIGV